MFSVGNNSRQRKQQAQQGVPTPAPSGNARTRRHRCMSINAALLFLCILVALTVYLFTHSGLLKEEMDDIPLPNLPKLSLQQRIHNLARPRYYLVVIAMFKNEAHIMREWLQHYISQGVEHFLLIDNGSTDPFRQVLRRYIDAGLVTLVSTPRQHFQAGAYNQYFQQHLLGRSRWVAVVDLDEFLFSPNPKMGIRNVLRQLDKRKDAYQIGQICVPWKMFGSSGYTKQPRCVVQSFTRRHARPTQGTHLWKCIARTDYVISLNVHQHETLGLPLCPDGHQPAYTEAHSNAAEIEKATKEPCGDMALDRALLHLNHYPIQAWDYFMRVKATRGDNVFSNKDALRGEKYFREYDALGNQTDDRGLATLQTSTDAVCAAADARVAVGMEVVLAAAAGNASGHGALRQ